MYINPSIRTPSVQYDRSFQRAQRIRLHIDQHNVAPEELAKLLEEHAEHEKFCAENRQYHGDHPHLGKAPTELQTAAAQAALAAAVEAQTITSADVGNVADVLKG